MSKQSQYLRKITISAIFLAIALVLKTVFTIDIPLFGANGTRIGVSGIFSMMPSILFGPFYGLIVGALSDFMGFLLKPTGAYMPLLTLTAALSGFLRGGIWMILKKRSGSKIRIVVIAVTLLLLVFGIFNVIFLSADGINNAFYDNNALYQANIGTVTPEVTEQVTDGMHTISRMLIERTITAKNPANGLATYIVSMTYGIIGSGALGLILICVDLLISRKGAKNKDSGNEGMQITQLLIAALVSGLIVTTINTVILREMLFPAWKLLPFALVWIPRVVEEILSNIVNVYFASLLYGVFIRQRNLRELIM